MLYISGSSGAQFEERAKRLRANDVVSAIENASQRAEVAI